MSTNEKNYSIVPILALLVAIGFVAGYAISEYEYTEVERTLATVEENNRELARRTKELQRRIGETEKRIAGAKTAVDDVRTDVGTVRKELGERVSQTGRIDKGLSAVQDSVERSVGLAGTAGQIVEECIAIVEEIESCEQD